MTPIHVMFLANWFSRKWFVGFFGSDVFLFRTQPLGVGHGMISSATWPTQTPYKNLYT